MVFTQEQASIVKYFVLEAANRTSEVAQVFDDIDNMTEDDGHLAVVGDMEPLWEEVDGDVSVWWRE